MLGAGRLNWVLEHFPWLIRHVPESRRVRFALGYLGPSGAWWLRERFEGRVPVLAPAELLGARAEGNGPVLRLGREGGSVEERRFAHVVAGSGFRHDVRRLPFLDPSLLARIEPMEGLASPSLGPVRVHGARPALRGADLRLRLRAALPLRLRRGARRAPVARHLAAHRRRSWARTSAPPRRSAPDARAA